MSSSSMLLFLVVVLLASSSAEVLPDIARAHSHGGGLKHIQLYMHEIASISPVVGSANTIGMVGMLDDELRDGPYPSNSSLVGRFQGLVALAGLVSPPGMQCLISFVFTAGDHAGSTLVMLGTIVSFVGDIERAIVGGTGDFRMARGYSVMKALSNPTPAYPVYELNIHFALDA